MGMKIDLTALLQAVIMLLSALITYRLIPWLKSKTSEQQFANLEAAARVAVYAAEQLYHSGHNDSKIKYAMDQLRSAGFDFDETTLRAAAEKAVYELKNTPSMQDIVEAIQAEPVSGETEETDSAESESNTAE